LPRPPTGALRPPVAIGPADSGDGDSFGRRAFVDRNASLSANTEGSGWTPWNAWQPRPVASDTPAETGGPATGGWGIAETGFEPPQMAGMPSSMPGPAAVGPVDGFFSNRKRRGGRDSPPPPPPKKDDLQAHGLQPLVRQPSVSINPQVEHVPMAPAQLRTVAMNGTEWDRGHQGNINAHSMARYPQGRLVQDSEMKRDRASGIASKTPSPFNVIEQKSSRSRPSGNYSHRDNRRNTPLLLTEQWVASHSPPVLRTPIIRYPSGVMLNIQAHSRMLAPLIASNIQHRPRMIQFIESGELVRVTFQAYETFDRDLNGFLSWNDGEIRDFITSVFQLQGLSPPSEGEMFELYSEFDVDRNAFLEARECLCLVDALFRAIFFSPETSNLAHAPSYLGAPLSRATSSGPTAATFILTPPPSDGGVIAYDPRSDVRVYGNDPFSVGYDPRSGVPPPRQANAWFPMAASDDLRDLLAPEASNVVEQQRTPPAQRDGVPYDGAPWPEDEGWSWKGIGGMLGLGNASSLAGWPTEAPPARPLGPTEAPLPGWPSGQTEAPLPGWPSEARDPSGRPPTLADAPMGGELAARPQDDWPAEAWSFKSLFSVFGSAKDQQEQIHRGIHYPSPGNLPAACAVCGNIYMEGSRFCRKCGAERPGAIMPPSMVVPASAQPKGPSWKKADIDPKVIPQGVIQPGPTLAPQRGAMPFRAPRPSASEIPKWQEQVETRDHMIEFDLEEVRIHYSVPDLEPEWHQSTSYYMSFHPFIEDPRDPPMPFDAPRQSQEGDHAVSKMIVAKKPTRDTGHPLHVQFKEKLVIRKDHLDPNCLGLLWGRKGNIAAEEFILVGKTILSLFDYSLQRKLIPFKILDATIEQPVADMLLKYEVKTTPGPVQLPLVENRRQDQVTLKWTPPLNDHGSPIQGYRIDILLTATENPTQGAEWFALCECTKTLKAEYVVQKLRGNTEYRINVRAVNGVGAGDSCEFQVQTAPVEPSAPSKPWIQEARDGCLCVAWHASKDSGGEPITSYKVQMRKIVGKSKPLIALFDTSDAGSAAFVQIGSVGAVMDELRDQPSVYTVWAGPLDDGKCEYCFQVQAMNRVGASLWSELTDPHYTT